MKDSIQSSRLQAKTKIIGGVPYHNIRRLINFAGGQEEDYEICLYIINQHRAILLAEGHSPHGKGLDGGDIEGFIMTIDKKSTTGTTPSLIPELFISDRMKDRILEEVKKRIAPPLSAEEKRRRKIGVHHRADDLTR
jgi:hypothetical protein